MCVFSPFPGLSNLAQKSDFPVSSRVADLATSFPLLFFMLASDCGPFDRRLEVLRLVQEGRALADIAAVYGLPYCLRRIRPEACSSTLPWVGWSSTAAPQLANLIPEGDAETGVWLSAIFHAARMCDEEFAIWLAAQRGLFGPLPLDTRLLLPLALYAWHTKNSESALALINIAPWSAEMGFARALEQAEAWLTRLHMLTLSGSYPIADTWFDAGSANGYDFIAITTLEALLAERAAMQNCLHTYVDKLATDGCRIFAVRLDGRSVATLEVAPFDSGRLHIAQLKGYRNGDVTAEVKAATDLWASRQRGRRVPSRSTAAGNAISRMSEWMKPFRTAIGMAPAATIPSASTLRDQLNLLRRHAAVTSRVQARGTGRPLADDIAALRGLDETTIERIRTALRARVGADVFEAWFRNLEYDGFDGVTVRTSTPARFVQRWIHTHYLEDLRASCRVVWPDVQCVEINQRHPMPQIEQQPPAAMFEALHGAGTQQPMRVRIEDILAAVSQRYQITRADILSQRRQRSVVLARQIGMYMARRLTARGLPEIGRRFGDRDHTTVLHAIRKIETMMEADPNFRAEIETLLRDAPRERGAN